MIRHLKATDLRRMPWKNGRGTTLEVASDATPGVGDWTWRVSVADVPESGAFSFFPGFDRIIACVEGNGMRLAVSGRQPIDVPTAGPGLRFSGDEATEGQLIDGPVRDANLFVKRGTWTGDLRVLRDRCSFDVPAADVIAIYTARGESTVRSGDRAEPVTTGEAALARNCAVSVRAAEAAVVVVAWAKRCGG